MAVNDLLSQEEIDALLHGVSEIDPDTETRAVPGGDGVRHYDFASEDRIVRGRMPALGTINERFSRRFRGSLRAMLRRPVEISFGGVEIMKFAEYVHTLFVPSSLNTVNVRPLRGNALVVFDPKLVFLAVDHFFGGDGRYGATIGEGEFTPTEQRVIGMLLEMAFRDLQAAWAPVMDLAFERVHSDTNPQFANIVSATEVVVSSKFHVEFERGGGEIHVTLPYAMLEPIRERLDSEIRTETNDIDERWARALREGVAGADLEVCGVLSEAVLPLRELVELKAGDVIPIGRPDSVSLRAEGVPLFCAELGEANDHFAVKILSRLNQRLLR